MSGDYKNDQKPTRNYNQVLAHYNQALKQSSRKSIKAFIFTTHRRRPRGTCTRYTLMDETTWDAASRESYVEIQDLPLKEEEAWAKPAIEHGLAPMARSSVKKLGLCL